MDAIVFNNPQHLADMPAVRIDRWRSCIDSHVIRTQWVMRRSELSLCYCAYTIFKFYITRKNMDNLFWIIL